MPTTSLDDSGDWANWLQSLLQNQGAAQPYGPGATPSGAGPGGVMPGGGVMNSQAATPGAPSMGYPAVGQAAGRPSVAPGMQAPAQNPVMRMLNALNPISPAEASTLSAPAPAPSRPLPPGAANSLPLASGNPTLKDYNIWLQSQQSAPAPTTAPPNAMPFPQDLGPAGRNMPYVGETAGSGQYDPRGYFAPPPGPLASQNAPVAGPEDPSIIARKKLMKPAATPASTATAPPAAAAPNRFAMIDRPNLPATGYSSGNRQMTALDLSRLFSRG